jgi:hypothetical protein
METLPVKIEKKAKTYKIEVDADRFERVAAALGMFSDEFLESIDRAERDIKAGRVKKLDSLADLM